MKLIVLLATAVLCSVQANAQMDSLINSGKVIEKGEQYYDSNRFELAIQEFRKIDPRDTNYLLALSKLAPAYVDLKKYEEAIAMCDEGLSKPSSYRRLFLVYKGKAFEGQQKNDNARQSYETAIREFPFYFYSYYSLGVLDMKLNEYEAAEALFFKVLSVNPFHAGSHNYLGQIAMLRGEKVRAMFALGVYMAINNSNNARLIELERFVKNEWMEEKKLPPSGNNPFSRYDEYIRSRIAMEKEYRTAIPIEAGIVRQYQLLFELLGQSSVTGSDPWTKFYLPIYDQLRKSGHQQAFIYHILKSTSIEQVKTWRNANEKSLNAMYPVINKAIQKNREMQTLPESWGYNGPVTAWYSNDNALEALGMENQSSERTGKWYYYNESGFRTAEGTYVKGRKTGLWKYYDEYGQFNSTVNYDNGETVKYYPEGGISQKYTQRNDKIMGRADVFYRCGNLKESLVYQDGKINGAGKMYFENGKTSVDYRYHMDSLEGEYVMWSENGNKKSIESYKKGKAEGAYTAYFSNGRKKTEGTYRNNQAEGRWTYYYENGKMKERSQYKENLQEGLCEIFNQAGELIETILFKEGKRHGDNIIYKNGKPFVSSHYDNDLVLSVTIYNPDGSVFDTTKGEGGNFSGHSYYSQTEISGDFTVRNGKLSGISKAYYRNGMVKSEYEYKDGRLDGVAKEYHENGKLKSRLHYAEGQGHGLYEEFYFFGVIKSKGWYQYGSKEQRWLTYFPNGTLETDTYFLNDEATGYQKSYAPDGKLYSMVIYDEDGKIKDMIRYNRNGEITTQTERKGAGIMEVTQKSSSGKLLYSSSLLCNMLDGPTTFYFPDGKIQNQNYYLSGNSLDKGYKSYSPAGTLRVDISEFNSSHHTRITWYYPNGKAETVGFRTLDGERDSLYIHFNEDGTQYRKSYYVNGKLEGISQQAGPDGILYMEKKYENGDMVAYRVFGPDGKLGEWNAFKGNESVVAKYPNGKIACEEGYKDGKLSGVRRVYFSTGQLATQYIFVDGNFEGEFVEYHVNGKLKEKGTYKNDEYEGKLEYYNINGVLELRSNYIFGLLNGTSEVFAGGNKVKEIIFWNNVPVE